jgi:signal transduction histidine kinase
LLRPIKLYLFTIVFATIANGSAYAARPIELLEGEFRLGDSLLTPEDGLTWLTVDTDSPDWQPYRVDEGHRSDEFTNVWRRFRLPDTALMDPTVYVVGWPSFEAYVDNQLVYQSGVLHPDPRNKFASHAWHLIPLPLRFSGKFVYFRIFSEQSETLSGQSWVSVASRSDHLIAMVRRELAQATVGLFLILIGCGALFVYFRRRFRPALNLGFFSISVGLFTVLHTDIASMLIAPSYFSWYLTHIPLYAFPIGLWLFLDDITDGGCPVIQRLAQLQLIYSTGALIADIFDYYPMYMTTPYMVLLSVSILIAVAITFRHLHRQKSEPDADIVEAKLLGLGFGLLMLSGALDLLAGFQIIPFLAPSFSFGVLAFVITLAIILERRFSLAHDQLRAYSRDLERRVEARTEDLGKKNEELGTALSDLQEAQHQLVIREKMASLGDLVAGVAHEVNTPIGAVNSSADVADRCIDKLSGMIEGCPGTDELREAKGYQQAIQLLKENTGLIKSAGERISKIVRGLRSFARLDEAEFQKVNIHEGIDSTLDLVHHQMQGKINVIKSYSPVLPEVECYPNQLNQVFMNLLVNASQAIENTGTITITTEVAGDGVTISVQDTGRGISEDDLSHVFDPGFTTKGVGVGTGLGLSISYKIVEDHSGRIEVDSQVGVGSTFRVVIPAARSKDTSD